YLPRSSRCVLSGSFCFLPLLSFLFFCRGDPRGLLSFPTRRSSDLNAMRQAHADGWFIVFDTLTLADDRLEAFYDNPNALRDYFRDIGRMVLAAEGRKANDSHADCYQYFCVPEYGT